MAPAAIRLVLLRRNLWLVVFGLGHGTLLYFGDFLGAYGLVGMIATVALLGLGDWWQRTVLWIWGASTIHVGVLGAVAAWRLAHAVPEPVRLPFSEVASLIAPTYREALRARLIEWPLHTATVVPFIMIVWLGIWAARQRLLEDPASQRRRLRAIALIGLGIAVAGGLPLALTSAGLLGADAASVAAMFLLHQVSGTFAGPGYVALAGLAALALSRRSLAPMAARIVACLGALGQRSLTGYLFQSVMWMLLLAPYGLALGGRFESPLLTAIVTASLVWAVSLAGAWALECHGSRGPAEALLRRLAYGRVRSSLARLPAPAPQPQPEGSRTHPNLEQSRLTPES